MNRSPWRKERSGGFSCRDCTERHINCHATCERYKAEKAVHEAKHEAEYREKLKQRDVNSYILGSIQKLKDRKRSKR